VGNQLWVYGRNTNGLLADNSQTHRSSPVQTVAGGTNWVQTASSPNGGAGIKNDGTLWTWGSNSNGIVGDNTATHRSSPVQTVAGGTDWKFVTLGWLYAIALKTNGSLWAWGQNTDGQHGRSDTTGRSSPIQEITNGIWSVASAGNYHTSGIKNDGTLWTWGRNTNGQLGVNDVTHRSSPTQVGSLTSWTKVSNGGHHTMALQNNGTLWSWGFAGASSRIGTGDATHRSSPVQTISGGTNWKLIAAGAYNSAAIKTDGTLWVWGSGAQGQIGDGSAAGKNSPTQTIAGGTNWKIVACGRYNVYGIKTDGTMWGWGNNSFGQIGTNDQTHRSSPVQNIMGGNNWKALHNGPAGWTVLATTFTES
jgi:alpha-tubulin suppressor-like RCC1 family protein